MTSLTPQALQPLLENLVAVESSSCGRADRVQTNWHRNPDGPAAAAEIRALLARIEELQTALGDAGEAIRELRLADGHANRTGDETRFDRALAAVCQHEGRARSLLAGGGE